MASRCTNKGEVLEEEEDVSSGIKFVEGRRGRRKVLLFGGQLFYFHSTVRQSTYFKCAQKGRGCGASVTVKGFNGEDCSYESYIVSNGEHLYHLPEPEEGTKKKEERSKINLETRQLDVKSEVLSLKMCKYVCLFCLGPLPPGYQEISALENVLPSGQILTTSLDDPVKNAQAFDLICTFLDVKWRKHPLHQGHHFNQTKSLPLCFKCQNLYQEVFQLHRQIRELERLLNQSVMIIRDVICRTEENGDDVGLGSTQLELLGLGEFRRQVVALGLSRIKEEVTNSQPKRVKVRPSTSNKDDNERVKPEGSTESTTDIDFVKQEVQDVDQTLNELLEDANHSFLETDDTGTDHSDPIPNSPSLHQSSDEEDDSEFEVKAPKKQRTRNHPSRKPLRSRSLQKHRKPTSFPCPQCPKHFHSKIILSNHLTAFHGFAPKQTIYPKSKKPIKSFTCHLCDISVLGAGPFLQHYRDLHPSEKRFTCRFCRRHFPYIRQVLTHQRRHTGEKPYLCPHCPKTFINDRALRYHRITAHNERHRIFACPLCPKTYPLKSSLTGHMYSHREYIVICKSCGKTFRTQNSFQKHNRIHHNLQAHSSDPITNPTKDVLESLGVSPDIINRKKCHLCMTPIPSKTFLQKHFKECHPDHPGDFKTCRCGQQFGSYKECFIHALRKHAPAGTEKTFQCDQCPCNFFTATELRSHSDTHIPVQERHKMHVCDHCGMGFASKTTLAQHMRKHQPNPQKFVCEICGKAYVNRRGLHQHRKTNHLKILPHKCGWEGCGKAFPLKSILLRHLNVHTGEVDFRCGECDKSFHYNNSLARHMKEVHGEGQTPRKRKGT